MSDRRKGGAGQMRQLLLALCLVLPSLSVLAQQPDPCAGLAGPALDGCRVKQQQLQQEQLSQEQQQLKLLQQQLTEQQQQITRQAEQLTQQQSELARQRQQIIKQQEQTNSDQLLNERRENDRKARYTLTPEETADMRRAEGQSWQAENVWFGSDYTKTQFAVRYAKQLHKERPDLAGRPFLDAVSAKVTERFGANR